MASADDPPSLHLSGPPPRIKCSRLLGAKQALPARCAMGRTSRRSARAASLAPGSPPPDEGVRPSDGAWEAAAMVDGELVRKGGFAWHFHWR